jgi:hypothetical protein
MESKTSLHAFCRDHGLAKSTIHRRCRELCIPTHDGISADDIQTLKEDQGITTAAAVDAELMEGIESPAPQPQTLTGGALVPRRGGGVIAAAVSFDQDEAIAQIEAMRQEAIASVQGVDTLMSRYAQSRIVQAFTEIDATVETVKSNALADMGLAVGNAQRRATGNG